MTDTTRSGQPAERTEREQQHPVKHVHHGRTPAAWAGTTITMVAFILGAIALIMGNWIVFWIAVALVVVALIVTVVMRKIGLGAD